MFTASKKSIGLDISDYSIELVEIRREVSGISASNYSRVEFDPGVVAGGRIANRKALESAIKQVFSSAYAGPIPMGKINFSLPDNLVYTHIFSLIEYESRERDRLVRREAAASIPIPVEDLIYSYHVLSEKDLPEKTGQGQDIKKKEIVISLFAAGKKSILEWREFLKSMGLLADLFDIEAFSSYRGLSLEKNSGSVCLIDIGAALTKISVFNSGKLFYTYDLKVAGNAFTDNIKKHVKTADGNQLDFLQAEKLKIQHGLDAETGSKEISQVLQSAFKDIFDEIKIALEYCRRNFGFNAEQTVLIGGSSRLKGALNFFSKTSIHLLPADDMVQGTGLEKDDPMKNKNLKSVKFIIGRPIAAIEGKELPIEYVGAAGMALRGLAKDDFAGEPSFSEKDLAETEIAADSPDQALETAEVSGRMAWFKNHPNETKLLALFLMGALAISGAFWLREANLKKAREKAASMPPAEYSLKKIVNLYLPISTEPSEYKSGVVRGRLVEYTIEQAGEYEKKIQEAMEAVKAGLNKGEAVWPEPLASLKKGESVVYPLKTIWMVFFDSDAKNYVMFELKKIAGSAEFMPGAINRLRIQPTAKEAVYLMEIEAEIYPKDPAMEFSASASSTANMVDGEGRLSGKNSAQPGFQSAATSTPKIDSPRILEEKAAPTSTASSSPGLTIDDIRKALLKAKGSSGGIIRVKSISSGFLNVRSGPGTSHFVVAKILPGEEYAIMEESGGWIKISLNENASTTEGWVSAGYVQKIAN